MNFQSLSMLPPIRIMMINPLVQSSRLTVLKILSGNMFGENQLIDIILLVFSNEIPDAEAFIQEILACGFVYLNTIVATSNLPSITDADIFCCMTNFVNPNILDFNTDNDACFDTFYLYIKVALSLGKSQEDNKEEDYVLTEDKPKMIKKPKPLFIGDGLLVLDILNIMGAEGMSGGYFCGGCMPALARNTLAKRLKVRATDINHVNVWGVNSDNFYVQFDKPILKSDKTANKLHCDWKMVNNTSSLVLNASWLRKEFVHKLTEMARKNPVGPIYRAWTMNKLLSKAWLPRVIKTKVYVSLGIISDGSLRTIKGHPYILPVILNPDGTWEINHCYEDMPEVILEIKRFNKIVRDSHAKLKRYCYKFLQENIDNQAFVPTEEDSSFSNFSFSTSQT